MFLKKKFVIKESLYATKTKNTFFWTYFLDDHIFGIQPSHVDLKKPTLLYSKTRMKINTSHPILFTYATIT